MDLAKKLTVKDFCEKWQKKLSEGYDAQSLYEDAIGLICSLDDGKQAAYIERDMLVAGLSRLFPAHLCRHPESDTSWENDWRWIVCIHGPTGQMTWHIHDSEKSMFPNLLVAGNHWDGHSTEEKYRRLLAIDDMNEPKKAVV